MQNNPTQSPTDDRRRAPRRRTLKSATISPDGQGTCFDCVVRNISETGIRVKVASQLGIPKSFRFKFPDEGIDQTAEIVWRLDKELGAVFVER